MKKTLITFTFAFTCGLLSLNAATEQPSPASSEKVKAIEQEIKHLEQQKNILQLELRAESHEELNQEMQSQKDVIEYDWTGVTGSLKNAEEAEHKAKFHKAKIHALDIEIKKLSYEKELLLQQKAGN
jgi:hypothetical protein